MNFITTRLGVSGQQFLCLFTLVAACGFSVANADDGAIAMDRVDAFLKATSTLSADFNQVLLDEQGRVIAESSGTMSIRRPGRFRWHYTAPEELLVVANGREVWSYDIELENATVSPQGKTLSGNPAALLAGDSSVSEAFKFKNSWRADAVDWVELTPQGDQKDFRSVSLGLTGNALVAMELHDQLGQTTRISFDRVLQNSPLKDDLFMFKPPEGVDVIKAGGLAP